MANMNDYIMRWRELSVDGVQSIVPHHDGEWVKFADIKELLQTVNQQPQQSICRWTLDDIDGKWDTECGEAHIFEADGPVENNHRFCPYCGKQLAVR